MRFLKVLPILALGFVLNSCTVMSPPAHRAKVKPKHYSKPIKGFPTPAKPLPKRKK